MPPKRAKILTTPEKKEKKERTATDRAITKKEGGERELAGAIQRGQIIKSRIRKPD